ncbi:MAG: hypothetical protein LBV03_05645, partial [Fusobacteriales bacterium]|nr:hypothetical protein [Fusobacteriales bacterium]
ELKKQYSYTEQTKKDQQGYNDYINRKNNQGILDLKKETEVNGLPANTVIIVRDETGKEIKYNNFDEYYYSKSPEEQAELSRLSAINNELGTKLSNAKTSEEKKKLEKELEQNQLAMNAIVYSKMTYNEYYTGKSLVESALSYKDGVLVVDKNKMLGEVEKADSAKGMEVGRIEGGASQQTVQDIRNKYGSSSISGSDTIPKDDSYIKYSVSDDEISKNVNIDKQGTTNKTIQYKTIQLQVDVQENVKLYRVMSEAEYNDLMSTGKFSVGRGSMETKWMATNRNDAQKWMDIMDFGNNPKVIEITVPKSALDNFYYPGSNLDNIGPAFSSEIDYLNKVMKSVK